MGATYRKRGKHSWLVAVHFEKQREFKTVHSEQDAKDLVKQIHKQELAGVNVVEAIRKAREVAGPRVSQWPTLRDALPAYIDQMAAKGEWTGSTPIAYRRRLATHVYDFELADGRRLGDLRVDQITEPMMAPCSTSLGRRLPTASARRSP
jgi:hypothetical protein